MSQEQEYELGWDDEIQKDGPEYVLLPVGDYYFTVTKWERERFNGSEKMPACNQAKLTIAIHSNDYDDQFITHRLLLHSRTEGLLSNFFTAIGQKKKDEKVKMNWNAVQGAKGKCEISHRSYEYNGEPRKSNQIRKFYPYDEAFPQGQQPSYQQPQTQQQSTTQQPFPTTTQPNQGGGFTPGQF